MLTKSSSPALHKGMLLATLALALLAQGTIATAAAPACPSPPPTPAPIVVVGSINVDIIIPVHRRPSRGETITSREPASDVAVGGKGANQAIAAARLTTGTDRSTRFVCRLGEDSFISMLEGALAEAGVDAAGCVRVPGTPSGQGIVLLEADGTASSVVLGGANVAWGSSFEALETEMAAAVAGAGALLLQREVPEEVNMVAARAARAAGVPVLLDIGGEERPLSDEALALADFVAPNESELSRLLDGAPVETEEQAVAAAGSLLRRGAAAVLVTLGERGALVVRFKDGKKSDSDDFEVIRQPAAPVPGGTVVDATAAGDAFRAAFAVGLVEEWPLQECLRFAAAAGAAAVAKMGAAPSLPTRAELLPTLPASTRALAEKATAAPVSCPGTPENGYKRAEDTSFPLKFASRLNSMAARVDLILDPALRARVESGDVLAFVERQGNVTGLDLVDFNYPQHLEGLKEEAVRAALASAGLAAGAINIRFPFKFRAGAFSNPDFLLRKEAVGVAAAGCRWASALGAAKVVVWSPYDGYDYNFQIDYKNAWDATVEAFRNLTDACGPKIKVSFEFKPTDEATRFSIVPSTGSALLLARQVGRHNFGLTLDVGHLLMAGENPAAAVAAAAAEGRLFGLHLNDAHVKLGAEDGLAFGSVNPAGALELVYWLKKVGYEGHVYYDTFVRNDCPVREAEYNIRRFKTFWRRTEAAEAAGMDAAAERHDGMAVLELLEKLES